jgi:hypothetical protein
LESKFIENRFVFEKLEQFVQWWRMFRGGEYSPTRQKWHRKYTSLLVADWMMRRKDWNRLDGCAAL